VSNSVITASVYDTPVTVEVLQSNGNLSVSANGNNITAEVNVVIDANIGSVHGKADFSDPAATNALQKSVSQNITQEIKAAFDTSKQLNSDFFGLEESLYRHDFKAWKKIKHCWDKVFQNAQIKINVETKILETGRIQRKPGGQ